MHRPNDLLMASTQRGCTLSVVLQAALAEAQKATQTAEANLLAECYARTNDEVISLCSSHAAVLNRCTDARSVVVTFLVTLQDIQVVVVCRRDKLNAF